MKFTILYVDDETDNLNSFKSVFRRDYNILITESAREGLDFLTENVVHLVLTDQRMPEMTGVEFLKKIYELFPDLPPERMIVSGYSKTKDIDEAKEKYKMSRFISKPWDHVEMKNLIDEAIGNCFSQN